MVMVNLGSTDDSRYTGYREITDRDVLDLQCTLRRSTLQGLMVVGLIVEEISNVDAKYIKVTGAQNIGQGHRVKVYAKSVHLGEELCKIW